jgi:hypothetical protein
LDKLTAALAEPSVTAIEADIVMGRDLTVGERDEDDGGDHCVPVMSHPPVRESSLSFATFLRLVVTDGNRLSKHIKLDFKQRETVAPALRELRRQNVVGTSGRTVFLNADVLAGPGKRPADVEVRADDFVRTCLAHMHRRRRRRGGTGNDVVAFSLGFKVEVHHPFGHTEEHLRDMGDLITRHGLVQHHHGVVLAINARLLCKNTGPFERFLRRFPSTQLLVWTGSTEPPISSRKVNYLRKRFSRTGHHDRVGFDCNVGSADVIFFNKRKVSSRDNDGKCFVTHHSPPPGKCLAPSPSPNRLRRRFSSDLFGMWQWICTACFSLSPKCCGCVQEGKMWHEAFSSPETPGIVDYRQKMFLVH